MTPAPTPSPTPTMTPTPTPTMTPAPTPSPTAAPRSPSTAPFASGDPRLAYSEFLLRVADDRSTVDALNRALEAGARAQDLGAVRRASVDILDFVDAERDWLREHPPAVCYADAHGSALAMLDAYGTAADRFVDWSASGGGLAGLGPLGKAIDAAQDAEAAAAAFGRVLEATTCRT
jgi:hypothetical protein